jgi:hypothetical protein
MRKQAIKNMLVAMAAVAAAESSFSAPGNSEQRIGAWEVRMAPDGGSAATTESTDSLGARAYYMCASNVRECRWVISSPAAKCPRGSKISVSIRGAAGERALQADCIVLANLPAMILEEDGSWWVHSAFTAGDSVVTIPTILGGGMRHAFSSDGAEQAVSLAQAHFLNYILNKKASPAR